MYLPARWFRRRGLLQDTASHAGAVGTSRRLTWQGRPKRVASVPGDVADSQRKTLCVHIPAPTGSVDAAIGALKLAHPAISSLHVRGPRWLYGISAYQLKDILHIGTDEAPGA